MTQVASSQARTRTATTWRLGEREPIATKYGASGQVDYWAVRIEWSEKLGLHLECRTEAQAVHMARVIKEAGRIDPDRWERYFLSDPRDYRRWTTFYAD